MRREGKLRLAWFSALEESDPESVSAYFTAQLLPHFASRFEIELFHPDFSRDGEVPAYHYLTALDRHARQPFDLFFYQIEDRRSSAFVRTHLGLMPGVTLMHDLLFLDYGPEPLLNSPWQSVVEKFNRSEIEWPARNAKFPRTGPIAIREAAFAAAPLFSSIRNLQEFNSHIDVRLDGSLPATYIPLPVDPRIFKSRRLQSISRIAYCGSPRIEGRAHKLLEALSSSESGFNLLWLVANEEVEQARMLLEENGVERAEVIGGRTPERWIEVSGRCDVAVHTLFSAYGQPGPYLEISLMRGMPVIVSRFGHTDHLSDSVVFKVEPGESEAVQIRLLLERLKVSPSVVDCDGVHRFARELFDRRAVAGELESVFHSAREKLAPLYQRWSSLQEEARAALLKEVAGLDASSSVFGTSAAPESPFQSAYRDLGWCR
jgi:hypothetical protein